MGAITGPRISVVGLGFVGLSLAVVNARNGYDTIGVDIDGGKVRRLGAGRPDFTEPGLDGMLARSINDRKIIFTTDSDHAIRNSEITFLTVGTPLKSHGGDVDLSHVRDAVERMIPPLKRKKKPHLLVVKSTVPPMTTENLILPMLKDVGDGRVVVNPEFLSTGHAINDLLNPHLIVIGSKNRQDSLVLEEYYNGFYKQTPRIMHTTIAVAEIIKYANNAFLATKISFINALGALCQGIPGADVNVVARAIGMDPGIGPLFLQAGPGFGGSCLPKDLAGLIRSLEKVGKDPGFFRAVGDVNDIQFRTIMDMVEERGCLAEGGTVAVLGLAFKSGTDDVRGSVSARVVAGLLEHKLNVRVHDPLALKNFERIFGTKISYHASVDECLTDSDCCILLTDAYAGMGMRDFSRMRTGNVIDARRVLDAKEFGGMKGFGAVGLGI